MMTVEARSPGLMQRSGFHATGQRFVSESPETIIGSLTANSAFDIDLKQRNAWLAVITNLKAALEGLPDSHVFLEFTIPRMGRRVDAVVLNAGCVFVIEYKIGSRDFHPIDVDQVVGYALDLKNFHEPSHPLALIPILVSTDAKRVANPPSMSLRGMAADRIYEPILSAGLDLRHYLHAASSAFGGDSIDPSAWVEGRYKPTPTIVEAAQALYRNHRVEEITRNEAGAENLSNTASYVSAVIEESKRTSSKAICIITGVPGSGKTLAGLNIANVRTKAGEDEYAVFLSGNGPLVKVLRAALARDQKDRSKEPRRNRGQRLTEARSIEQFIQNIHHFRDANVQSNKPPVEKVVIFDEAQRAWDRRTTNEFMRKKRSAPLFDASEPEFLLSVMDRHRDWCTVVCLVGHGQEINTGEAGLNEWLTALSSRFPHWRVHLSDRIVAEPWAFGVSALPAAVVEDSRLHLATSIRSFRSESVSAFVSAVIDGKLSEAKVLSSNLGHFEFNITRDLQTAKDWIKRRRRGTERAGLLGFSNAIRLKSEGVFVKADIDCVHWFLANRLDVRASDYLEDIATEFDVQGLELDWTCVCLDTNLRISVQNTIEPMVFRGTKWQTVNDAARKAYVLNAHRVLLTRARQGVVIYLPRGNDDDPTRQTLWYSRLYDYLVCCGVESL
jgi:hypothetical protein